jgi:hypothetical protein
LRFKVEVSFDHRRASGRRVAAHCIDAVCRVAAKRLSEQTAQRMEG